MSSAPIIEWALEKLPEPSSLPYIGRVGLPPLLAGDHLQENQLGALPLTLDLAEDPNVLQGDFALTKYEIPHFGLTESLFSPWSAKSFRLQHLQHLCNSSTTAAPPHDLQLPCQVEPTPCSSTTPLPRNRPSSSDELLHRDHKPPASSIPEAKARHYAQNSRLSAEQHRQWWSLRNTPSQSNVNDHLKTVVAAEQRLYKESLKQYIMETCMANYVSYPQLVESCIENLLDYLKRRTSESSTSSLDFTQARYPPYYTPSGSLRHPFLDPRHPPKPINRSSSSLTHASTSTGTPPVSQKILFVTGKSFELPTLPNPLNSVVLPRSGEFWLAENHSRQRADPNTVTKAPATSLKQVQPPVSKDANIRAVLKQHHYPFVASVSTITTLTSPSIEISWEIPVIVTEDNQGGSINSKTVFLDKPLVSRDMSIKQKNEKFYKMSLKRWLLQNREAQPMAFPGDQLSIDPEVLKSIVQQQHCDTPNVENGPDMMIYSEWKMDDEVGPLLVRGRSDGFFISKTSPSSTPVQRPTAIVCKMQHVPDYQLEEFSAHEKAKYLMKSVFLGSESRILVGHVNPVAARLVSVESLTQSQLRPSGTSASLGTYFSQLNDVLSWLKTLGKGEYLLSHESGEFSISINRLYWNKEDVQFSQGIAATYNLHERQIQAGRSNLDLVEYLAPRWDFHRINQIPNTFPPVSRSCCFDFLRYGKCGHPQTCTHVHISQIEADLRGFTTPSSGRAGAHANDTRYHHHHHHHQHQHQHQQHQHNHILNPRHGQLPIIDMATQPNTSGSGQDTLAPNRTAPTTPEKRKRKRAGSGKGRQGQGENKRPKLG